MIHSFLLYQRSKFKEDAISCLGIGSMPLSHPWSTWVSIHVANDFILSIYGLFTLWLMLEFNSVWRSLMFVSATLIVKTKEKLSLRRKFDLMLTPWILSFLCKQIFTSICVYFLACCRLRPWCLKNVKIIFIFFANFI